MFDYVAKDYIDSYPVLAKLETKICAHDVITAFESSGKVTEEDDGERKAGQANGYGTVAVDLAAEAAKAKETMKALRAAQMNKPPPIAMKKNPITGEMEKFESPALQDDLGDEDVDGEIDVADMGCGADDY